MTVTSRLRKPLSAALCLLFAAMRPAAAIDTGRPDVSGFIEQVSSRDSLDKRQLHKLLRAAKSQPAIIDAMNRPAEKAKPWFEYRSIFLTDRRIREGGDFWLAHRQQLDRASVRSGVAPEYIAAIIGVETFYGRSTGSYRVIDALATLAFDYPARAPFFRDELEQFILLARDMRFDPLAVKGSYAGAMGAPQFMPSNYRRYGVDADADGRIDLWGNWSDVCASVGNYLKEHGWNPGEPVLSEAAVNAGKAADLDGRRVAPQHHSVSRRSQTWRDLGGLLVLRERHSYPHRRRTSVHDPLWQRTGSTGRNELFPWPRRRRPPLGGNRSRRRSLGRSAMASIRP